MNQKEFIVYLGNNLEDRLRFKFVKEKRNIIDLVLQYEALINENWQVIVRYDCAHGFFHRDVMHPSGRKEKKAIETPDLNFAFEFAKQDLEDKWAWYKEQYIKKMKK